MLLLPEQRYTRFVLLRNVLVTQFFVSVHNFFYPHFPIRIRHSQVSGPRFADTSFASRFFDLFTLPTSLKLNTQRRSAPSMCACKEEERSVLISVTLQSKQVKRSRRLQTDVSINGKMISFVDLIIHL